MPAKIIVIAETVKNKNQGLAVWFKPAVKSFASIILLSDFFEFGKPSGPELAKGFLGFASVKIILFGDPGVKVALHAQDSPPLLYD